MKLVLCCGCFDLLHIGHIRHLEQARALGDRLLVCVTPDLHVNKGVSRPFFTAALRVEALNQIRCVDLAFEGNGPTAVESILLLKPAIYCKGPRRGVEVDWSQGLRSEAEAVNAVGGRVAFTDGERGVWSSTEIGQKILKYG